MLDMAGTDRDKAKGRQASRHASTAREGGAPFARISADMAQLAAARDQLIMDAFGNLEARHADLAEMLVCFAGDRTRAARWMCVRQDCFDGMSGYDVLAQGDADAIWDRISS